ncbi:MAG: exodeoxyribonuclease VII small subunit [bacterium]
MTKKNAPELTYESAVMRIEQIVNSLDRSDLPLAEALKMTAEATELIKFCQHQLNDASGKLEKILAVEDGKIISEEIEEI